MAKVLAALSESMGLILGVCVVAHIICKSRFSGVCPLLTSVNTSEVCAWFTDVDVDKIPIHIKGGRH